MGTLADRWAFDEELADELRAEGQSFVVTDPSAPARWEELEMGPARDAYAAAKPPPQPDER